MDSVNGQTGTVVLDADDVGALPDTTAIPTKTSDLTNDSGFLTQHQSLEAYRTASAQDVIDAGTIEGLTVGAIYTIEVGGTWTGKFNPNPSSYSFPATINPNAVTITYSLISQISTLGDLKEAIREGCASQLTIGQQITIPWTDLATGTDYQIPCDIVD